jgi:hypothetical protein
MSEQVLRDPVQPLRPDRIETRLFEGVEEIGVRAGARLVPAMDGRIVKARAQRETIAEGAQPGERGGIRLRDRGVGVLEPRQYPRARPDGFDRAIGKRTAHFRPGPRRSSGRSWPMQRW